MLSPARGPRDRARWGPRASTRGERHGGGRHQRPVGARTRGARAGREKQRRVLFASLPAPARPPPPPAPRRGACPPCRSGPRWRSRPRRCRPSPRRRGCAEPRPPAAAVTVAVPRASTNRAQRAVRDAARQLQQARQSDGREAAAHRPRQPGGGASPAGPPVPPGSHRRRAGCPDGRRPTPRPRRCAAAWGGRAGCPTGRRRPAPPTPGAVRRSVACRPRALPGPPRVPLGRRRSGSSEDPRRGRRRRRRQSTRRGSRRGPDRWQSAL